MWRVPVGAAVHILVMSAPAVAQEWIEFTSRQDRFTANFPGQPQITETTYRSQFGADLPAGCTPLGRGRVDTP